MEKIEKTRKLFKRIQYIGMAIIIIVGVLFIYLFGLKNADSQFSNTLTYIMFTIMVLFIFVAFVTAPMQNKLLKLIIIHSLDGLVTDLTFNKKKGYSKESFIRLNIAPDNFTNYGCADYYSFMYNDMLIESTTARAFDEIKVPKKSKNGKVSKKLVKSSVNYFHGRIYIIPFESDVKFSVYGRKNPSVSRKNEMANTEYNLEMSLKVKKQQEHFEVFYKNDNKPNPAYIQSFVDKLLNLRLQAKGPVSVFVRKNTMVLLIDNGRFYKEVEIKNPIDERLVRDYRKDVSMVLSFINALKKENNK